MRHILLFEPGVAGHRLGWIRIIIAEFLRRQAEASTPAHLTVAAPHSIVDALGGVSNATKAHGVAFWPLRAIGGVPWRRLTDLLATIRPDTLLLLELTPWEPLLARRRLPCPVAGILFVQYPEIDPSKGPPLIRLERRLRRLRKEWLTRRWLLRQDWRAVFLLNGERACATLNRRFANRPVFRPLPDPVEVRGPRSKVRDSRVEVGVRKSDVRIRFLHPGVLSRRKGMEAVFRALELVSDEWCSRCEVVIAGCAEADYRTRFARALARLRRRRPDARVEWRDEYLSEADFDDAFRSADWILMPYSRSEYSSGILVHAAAAGVPVLGPSDGLLGRLIEEFALGRTCAVEPCTLADALEDAAQRPFEGDDARREAFVRRNAPTEFAKRILEACRPEVRGPRYDLHYPTSDFR